METVRAAIQEHCNAIQEILREENDHWQEIHSAIDQYVFELFFFRIHVSLSIGI